MESDPTRMCELLVGLPEMNVLGVMDVADEMLRVHVETRVARTGCERCGVIARVKEQPVVVLVDHDTASSAEIVTAALQDHHRATVVGTHTFGKGVFQEEQSLANGGALDITVGEYFTPNGRNLGGGGVKQGAGVIPEVRVPSSIVDNERGLDVALSTLAAKVK